MAQYKDREFVSQSTDIAFDIRHRPGAQVENPGIYRCTGCCDEIMAGRGARLPENGHRPHAPDEGKIEWRLLVLAQPRK